MNVFLFLEEGHFSAWANLFLLPLCLSPTSFVCPTASSLISHWKKKEKKERGWLMITEPLGYAPITWQSGWFLPIMAQRQPRFVMLQREGTSLFSQVCWECDKSLCCTHSVTHTHSLLFLHAGYKGGTANPLFSPGVLMVLVMGGMRQTVFVWGPELDFNQNRHLPTPAKPPWMRSCIEQRHTRTRRGFYSLWGYEV